MKPNCYDQAMKPYLSTLKLAVSETLWPTRCAICDTPNHLLCKDCWLELPFIDQYRACPLCGAPFGQGVCCECNPVSLEQKGFSGIPLDACVSVFQATPNALKLITTYKDRGETRLGRAIALLLKPCIDPTWPPELIITTIPARKQAKRTRGFDHMLKIGRELSAETALPFISLLDQKESRDQRELTAKERISNKQDSFFMKDVGIPSAVLILDDVFTTGATLFAAALTLRESGVSWVGGLTLARVC